MASWLTVVGIGEDGFKGLGKNARHALLRASRIIGGQRQLDLLPVCIRGEQQLWPSPFSLEPVLPLTANDPRSAQQSVPGVFVQALEAVFADSHYCQPR